MELNYKKLAEHNAEELKGLWDDPDVIRYTNVKEPCDLTAIKIRMESFAASDTFSILIGDTLVGVVGCPCIDAKAAAYGLFYQLKKAYWGRGIATLAAEWIIDYMNEKYVHPTFYADVVTNNIASESILVHLGFTCISEQVISFKRDGIQMDVHNYRLYANSAGFAY